MASHGEEVCQFKVLLIGGFKFGKSQILTSRTETETETTVMVEYETKIFHIEEKSVKASIRGNVGQERNIENSKADYEAADGVILVYDITNRKSFDCMTDRLKNAKEGQAIILIGHKSGSENDRKVSTKEAEGFAKEKKLLFSEISKLEGTDFEDALEQLLKELVTKKPSAAVPAGNSQNNFKTENAFNNGNNAQDNVNVNNNTGNITIQKK